MEQFIEGEIVSAANAVTDDNAPYKAGNVIETEGVFLLLYNDALTSSLGYKEVTANEDNKWDIKRDGLGGVLRSAKLNKKYRIKYNASGERLVLQNLANLMHPTTDSPRQTRAGKGLY
jgi:hypothetical protein